MIKVVTRSRRPEKQAFGDRRVELRLEDNIQFPKKRLDRGWIGEDERWDYFE